MQSLKEEIMSEISDIPENEMPDLIQIIRIFKRQRKGKKSGFAHLNKWRGGLKDLKLSSVDLQHKISDMWGKNYVSD